MKPSAVASKFSAYFLTFAFLIGRVFTVRSTVSDEMGNHSVVDTGVLDRRMGVPLYWSSGEGSPELAKGTDDAVEPFDLFLRRAVRAGVERHDRVSDHGEALNDLGDL